MADALRYLQSVALEQLSLCNHVQPIFCVFAGCLMGLINTIFNGFTRNDLAQVRPAWGWGWGGRRRVIQPASTGRLPGMPGMPGAIPRSVPTTPGYDLIP